MYKQGLIAHVSLIIPWGSTSVQAHSFALPEVVLQQSSHEGPARGVPQADSLWGLQVSRRR